MFDARCPAAAAAVVILIILFCIFKFHQRVSARPVRVITYENTVIMNELNAPSDRVNE